MNTEHRAPFQAGDWTVEPELNCLRKDDQEKHLEPKVMKVLLALAEHPNHVVTKEDLIAAVWPGTFVSDDVLTRCISVLRRVTQDDATMPHFIQTVPKVGYRLLAPIHELLVEPGQEQGERGEGDAEGLHGLPFRKVRRGSRGTCGHRVMRGKLQNPFSRNPFRIAWKRA